MDPNCTEPWHLKILFLISFSLSIQSTIIILYFTLNSTTTTLVMPRRTFINPQNTGLNLTPTSLKLGESNHVILSDPRPHLRLIYISGDGLGYGLGLGFLFCRGITRIHRSPSRPRPAVRPTAVLINIHEHLI